MLPLDIGTGIISLRFRNGPSGKPGGREPSVAATCWAQPDAQGKLELHCNARNTQSVAGSVIQFGFPTMVFWHPLCSVIELYGEGQ